MRLLNVMAIGAAAILFGQHALAGSKACEKRVNNNHSKLLECVTVEGVRAHQAELQAAADANGGNRVAGSSGYDESALYVGTKLEEAGYSVIYQPFDFPFFEELSDAELEQISPNPTNYPYFDADGFATMSYSGSNDVTAMAQAVDVVIPFAPAPNTSTSGCEASDFDTFVSGSIAILQRGSCSFAIKAINAEDAGAVGVVIFNEGQPGREDAFVGTLGGPVVNIPVVGANYNVGVELATGIDLMLRIKVEAISENRSTFNVLAESQQGNPDNVVMIGAHLDSVEEGPGIQDNGSGSAAILEVALRMAKVNPINKVRFAWWSAEEAGLLGSEYYVNTLTEESYEALALYLNFDMIGSPNFYYGIYDGDDSDEVGAGPGPDGSAHIEATFEQFYKGIDTPFQGTDFSGRSDYGPFIAVGIPAGGLFTGAEGIKTTDEAMTYGGTAGDQYDPCYHLACDNFDNISLEALDVNADAVAYATLAYAMSTTAINGLPGKGNFSDNKLAKDAEMGKLLYRGSHLQQ